MLCHPRDERRAGEELGKTQGSGGREQARVSSGLAKIPPGGLLVPYFGLEVEGKADRIESLVFRKPAVEASGSGSPHATSKSSGGPKAPYCE